MKIFTPKATTQILGVSAKAWRWVPIVALWRGLKTMNARRWKVFLVTFFMSMWIGTALAQASEFGGTGVSALIPLEDWSNGGAKTLVEDIPNSSYSIESTKGGLTNPIIDSMTGIASTLMLTLSDISYIVVVIMSWLLGSTVAFEDSLNISPILDDVATESFGWLFPTCLALGGLFTYFDYLKDKSALNGLFSLVIAAVAAVSLVLFPNVWVSGLETARAVGNTVVSAVSDSSGGSSTAPFEYEEVSFSGNTDSQAFTRRATDAVWRQMVVTPWCMAQFGSVGICQKYGKELLKKESAQDKQAFLEKEVLPEVGEDSPAGQIITGDAWSHKLGSAFMAALLVVIMGFLISSLVFSAVIAFFQAMLLLMLGVFFLPLGMIPGVTRSWLITWATTLGGVIMANVVAMLMLSISLGVVTYISTSSMPYGRQFFVSVVVLMAAFGLKNTVASITGSGSAGSSGGMVRSISRVVQAIAMRKMLGGALSHRGSRNNNIVSRNQTGGRGPGGPSSSNRTSKHRQDATTRQVANKNRNQKDSGFRNNNIVSRNQTGGRGPGGPSSSNRTSKHRQDATTSQPAKTSSSNQESKVPKQTSAQRSQISSASFRPVREASSPVASANARERTSSRHRSTLPAPVENGLRTSSPPVRRTNRVVPKQKMARSSVRSRRAQQPIKARKITMRTR